MVALEPSIFFPSSSSSIFFSPQSFLTSIPPRLRRPSHTPTVHLSISKLCCKILQQSFSNPSVHQDSQIHSDFHSKSLLLHPPKSPQPKPFPPQPHLKSTNNSTNPRSSPGFFSSSTRTCLYCQIRRLATSLSSSAIKPQLHLPPPASLVEPAPSDLSPATSSRHFFPLISRCARHRPSFPQSRRGSLPLPFPSHLLISTRGATGYSQIQRHTPPAQIWAPASSLGRILHSRPPPQRPSFHGNLQIRHPGAPSGSASLADLLLPRLFLPRDPSRPQSPRCSSSHPPSRTDRPLPQAPLTAGRAARRLFSSEARQRAPPSRQAGRGLLHLFNSSLFLLYSSTSAHHFSTAAQ